MVYQGSSSRSYRQKVVHWRICQNDQHSYSNNFISLVRLLLNFQEMNKEHSNSHNNYFCAALKQTAELP